MFAPAANINHLRPLSVDGGSFIAGFFGGLCAGAIAVLAFIDRTDDRMRAIVLERAERARMRAERWARWRALIRRGVKLWRWP